MTQVARGAECDGLCRKSDPTFPSRRSAAATHQTQLHILTSMHRCRQQNLSQASLVNLQAQHPQVSMSRFPKFIAQRLLLLHP